MLNSSELFKSWSHAIAQNTTKAQTLGEQLEAVQNMITKCNNEKELNFLCAFYLHCPVKHPIRNIIYRFLKADESYIKTIAKIRRINALSNSINAFITTFKTERAAASLLNDVIESISECLHNFANALFFSEENALGILSFGILSLEVFLNELLLIQTSSKRNTYFSYIQNSICFLTYYIESFNNPIKKELNTFNQLNIFCNQIITDGNVPMNLRVNTATLLACIAKLSNRQIQLVKNYENLNSINNVVLFIGTLHSYNVAALQHHAGDLHNIINILEKVIVFYVNVPKVLICIARAFYHISHIIQEAPAKKHVQLNFIKAIISTIINFALAFLEHDIEVIRYICRDMLFSIITIFNSLQLKYFLNQIYNIAKSNALSMSVRCLILKQTTAIVGVKTVINNCSFLFPEIFAHNLGKDSAVNDLYECLMLACQQTQSFENWYLQWITYLLRLIQLNDARLCSLEQLLIKCLRVNNDILTKLSIPSVSSKVPIRTKLLIARTIRKYSLKFKNFERLLEIAPADIQFSLLSLCEETRHMALCYLVENVTSTADQISARESSLIIVYLKYNLNIESANTRQRTVILITSVLDKCGFNIRKHLDDKGKHLAEYDAFLHEIIQILFENISASSNFNRRIISAQILENFLQIADKHELLLKGFASHTLIDIMVHMLNDPYIPIKEIALSTFKLRRKWTDKYKKYFNIHSIKHLIRSANVDETITGAYQLQLYYDVISSIPIENDSISNVESSRYAILHWLLLELRRDFIAAKVSIIKAATTYPLYGILFSIRRLLMNLDFSIISEDTLWQSIIIDLVHICKSINDLVTPIVNDMSPEGYLPSDTITLNISKAIVSRLLLVCGWRTTKEIALILGNIVYKMSVLSQDLTTTTKLLNVDHIVNIGIYLQNMLFEAKHRGAFEQTYIGFYKYSTYLWCTENLHLNSLPMKWAEDVIDLIQEKSSQLTARSICATRRGAGIPFIMQALISSEIKCRSTHTCLHYCIEQLLRICSSTERSIQSRTHAMNIMRLLYRSADLKERIAEFLAEGMIAAINAFASTNWMEKNSAALLFAALMQRMFGNEDSAYHKNKSNISSQLFYIRYPKLYQFMVTELERAFHTLQEPHTTNDKIHLLLLMVKRLHFCGLEEKCNYLPISKYLPYILEFSTLSKFNIRVLVAKVACEMFTEDQVRVFVLYKCKELQKQKLNANSLHGNLLMIWHLIKKHSTILKEDLIIDLITLLVKCNKLCKKNAVIYEIILNISIILIKRVIILNLDITLIKNFKYLSTLQMYNMENICVYPIVHSTYFIYKLYVIRATTASIDALQDYLLYLNWSIVKCWPSEYKKSWLKLILLILIQNLPSSNFIENAYEFIYTESFHKFDIKHIEMEFVLHFNKSDVHRLATSIKNSQIVHNQLHDCIRLRTNCNETITIAYTILSLLDTIEFRTATLLRALNLYPNECKYAIMLCVLQIIRKRPLMCKQMEYYLENIWEFAQSHQPKYLRFATTMILPIASGHFVKAVISKNIKFIKLFIIYILNFLMDDDIKIREFTIRLILYEFYNRSKLTWIPFSRSHIDSPFKILPIKCRCVVPMAAYEIFLHSVLNIMLALDIGNRIISQIFENIINDIMKLSQKCKRSNCHHIPDELNEDSSDLNNDQLYAEPMKIANYIKEIFLLYFKNTSEESKYIESFVDKK